VRSAVSRWLSRGFCVRRWWLGEGSSVVRKTQRAATRPREVGCTRGEPCLKTMQRAADQTFWFDGYSKAIAQSPITFAPPRRRISDSSPTIARSRCGSHQADVSRRWQCPDGNRKTSRFGASRPYRAPIAALKRGVHRVAAEPGAIRPLLAPRAGAEGSGDSGKTGVST
jgi:hypothetical protein